MRESDLLKVTDYEGVDQNKTTCLLSVVLHESEEKWLDYLLCLIWLCGVVHLSVKA